MKKVTLSLVTGVAIVGIGIPVWASTQTSSTKNTSPESSQTLTTKANESTSSAKNTQESKEMKPVTPSSSKSDTPSSQLNETVGKNQSEFNTQAIQQNFYLKTVSTTGEVSYTKATDETLKTLEGDRGANDLKVTRVQYQGELISVID